MFAKIKSAGLFGVHGFLTETEADSGTGLPGVYLTGALSPETREAQFRVFTAAKNSGIRLKPQKVTINIAPASRRKEGTGFDLSILMAVLLSQEMLPEKEYPIVTEEFLRTYAFLGELGLDGSLKPVRGVLPMADALHHAGIQGLVVPKANEREAALVLGLQVVSANSIAELLHKLRGERLCGVRGEEPREDPEETFGVDFSEVRGQLFLKRAAEIAVSGRHNILFSGAAGSGKTMIAKRIPSIMPGLSRAEEIELSKLYSICGLLPAQEPLIRMRPFRAPHHGSTAAAILGGGNPVRPGEISLASKGVLFLDELPLFKREALEALREPMEAHKIIVTRVSGSYEFPAEFMLVAACNNCPCGFYPDRTRCRCTNAQLRLYQGRLSRPLMERFDLIVQALPVGYEALRGAGERETGESSAVIRKRVEAAVKRQQARFCNAEKTRWNGEMTSAETEAYCVLSDESEAFLKEIYRKRGLSARTLGRVLRVARTISDMAGAEEIETVHLAEAVSLRAFEYGLWGGSAGFRAGEEI